MFYENQSEESGPYFVKTPSTNFYAASVYINHGTLYIEGVIAISTISQIRESGRSLKDVPVFEQMAFASGEWKQIRTVFESELKEYKEVLEAK